MFNFNMNKSYFIMLISCMTAFLLCSCNPNKSTIDIPIDSHSDSNQIEVNVTDQLLNETSTESIIRNDTFDYDMDGKIESFYLTGEPCDYYDSAYTGSIWYKKNNTAKEINEKGDWIIDGNVKIGEKTFWIATKLNSTQKTTYFYSVLNNDVIEMEISGIGGDFTLINGTDFFLFISETDAIFDDQLGLMGRTYKPYKFYYEPSKNAFHEYGSVEISLDEFQKYEGSADILKELQSLKGEITSLLLRLDGKVIVNYRCEENNYFAIMSLADTKVTLDGNIKDDDNVGIYRTACCPEIAVFPE